LSQIDRKDFEIIVVDNYSSDSSFELLEEMYRTGKIDILVRMRCSRGLGRQIAYLLSKAQYIVANIDTDVIYNNKIVDVLADYQRHRADFLYAVYGAMILPRCLAERLGGWRDLDRHEDSDLCARAFAAGCYMHDLRINVVEKHLKKKQHILKRFIENYTDFRDWFRIGMKIHELPGGVHIIIKPSVLLAFLTYRWYKRYSNPKFDEWIRIWRDREVFSLIINCS
jgi:glycosyltransferase involved in cell wall biosynthesis